MGPQFRTDFLTPANSFVSGMGSVLNIGGNYFDYNISSSPQEADTLAIYMDWRMIGEDIANSMRYLHHSDDNIEK